MFQTNSKGSLNITSPDDDNQLVWRCISHQLGMPWFYARERVETDKSPTSLIPKMIMTSSIEDLLPMLIGKNNVRSIEKIQLITNSFNESPSEPDIQLGLVTRIIRFSCKLNKTSKYFIESTEGVVLEGPLDGTWGSCERNVLMDVLDSVSDAGSISDERRAVRETQMKVIIQAVDLFREDVEASSEWLWCKDPRLNGKAPKDLETEAEYRLLTNFIDNFKQRLFS